MEKEAGFFRNSVLRIVSGWELITVEIEVQHVHSWLPDWVGPFRLTWSWLSFDGRFLFFFLISFLAFHSFCSFTFSLPRSMFMTQHCESKDVQLGLLFYSKRPRFLSYYYYRANTFQRRTIFPNKEQSISIVKRESWAEPEEQSARVQCGARTPGQRRAGHWLKNDTSPDWEKNFIAFFFCILSRKTSFMLSGKTINFEKHPMGALLIRRLLNVCVPPGPKTTNFRTRLTFKIL